MEYKVEFDVRLWSYVVYINGEKKVLNVSCVRKAHEKLDFIRKCNNDKLHESRLSKISQ